VSRFANPAILKNNEKGNSKEVKTALSGRFRAELHDAFFGPKSYV